MFFYLVVFWLNIFFALTLATQRDSQKLPNLLLTWAATLTLTSLLFNSGQVILLFLLSYSSVSILLFIIHTQYQNKTKQNYNNQHSPTTLVLIFLALVCQIPIKGYVRLMLLPTIALDLSTTDYSFLQKMHVLFVYFEPSFFFFLNLFLLIVLLIVFKVYSFKRTLTTRTPKTIQNYKRQTTKPPTTARQQTHNRW